ncbi:hypothetical protein [Helicobacter cetorum]|uniref:hypothetical protein n=1 Tax=Helicobacter cetorum TaxID=138563 RepID=UPI0002FEDF94|nr:hypothetical protein [Helicobacter cetorum]
MALKKGGSYDKAKEGIQAGINTNSTKNNDSAYPLYEMREVLGVMKGVRVGHTTIDA